MKKAPTREYSSIGLDIGASCVKAVKLKRSNGGVELVFAKIEPVGDSVASCLKKILENETLKSVNISVSGPSAVIRYVNFPKMSLDELRKSMKFEAQKFIPYSLDEVNLDSGILKDGLPDNKMLVLVAAAKKGLINERLQLVEGLGLKVNAIDIDPLALINAFTFNYSPEETEENRAVGLLNIGAWVTSLDILEDGLPRFSRYIQTAGNSVSQKLADSLNTDFKTAEAIKINPSSDKEGKVATSMEQVAATIAAEMRVSFDYYESQNASSVGKIFISGGTSRLAGIKDSLENILGLKVEAWDPFRKLTPGQGLQEGILKEMSSQSAVAVGLALHS